LGVPPCGSGVFAKFRLRSYSRSVRARALVAGILHFLSGPRAWHDRHDARAPVVRALLGCTNETDSLGELARGKEIEYAVARNAGDDRGSDPDVEMSTRRS